MRLRNKKTGKIIGSACVGIFKHQSSGNCERVDTEARSLEKVLEIWEDYTPQEPLIKDEIVRKIVLRWYNVNFPSKDYEIYYIAEDYRLTCHSICIDFQCNRGLDNLNEDTAYTIAELCGEEE